jgi:hypothetical protein
MQLRLTKEDLNNNQDKSSGGLEISIPGVLANPTDAPGKECPIFIEYYEGKVLVHVWDGKEDPTTITLTNRS